MNNYRRLFYIFIFPFLIFSLYIIIKNYDNGDQRVYRILYEIFSEASWKEVLKLSVSTVTGHEILSPYILWFGAFIGIDKDIYITFLNLILLYFTCEWLFKNKVSWYIIFLIITNFYLIVLFTSAERLKISYIFLSLCTLQKNQKSVFFFALLAIISHMQSILLLIGFAIYFSIKEQSSAIIKFKTNKKFIFGLLFSFLIAVFVIFFLGESLLKKGLGYSSKASELNFTVILQALILYISVSCLFFKNKAFNIMSIYFFICIMILGGSRVNMIYFTAVLFILVYEKKLSKPNKNLIPFLLIALYLSYKSIEYINNVLIYGDGFYS